MTELNKKIVTDFSNYQIGTCKVYRDFIFNVDLNITKYNDGIGLHYYNKLGRLVDLGLFPIKDLLWKLDKIKAGVF